MPHGRKFYALLLKILLVAKTHPRQDEIASFCLIAVSMAVLVVTALPADQRPVRLHPIFATYGRPGSKTDSSSFNDVFAVIYRVTSVAQCCNPECSHTSESSAQKLRFCARCNVMRYCSIECQKTAWASHKKVCKDLGMIKASVMKLSGGGMGSLGKSLEKFERKASKLGFSGERMREIAVEIVPFLHFENAGLEEVIRPIEQED
ncbi:hypothetical protein C8R44DRAFT_853348 [Mycena epipterygia]|nr:hypothetical protein C8R44DRAFT_853348 [Mycena epipterygia]